MLLVELPQPVRPIAISESTATHKRDKLRSARRRGQKKSPTPPTATPPTGIHGADDGLFLAWEVLLGGVLAMTTVAVPCWPGVRVRLPGLTPQVDSVGAPAQLNATAPLKVAFAASDKVTWPVAP